MTQAKMPTSMKAMVLMRHGDLDAYAWHTDWPVPKPSPTEVLVKVAACGLNNTDVNTRMGWYSKAVTGATGEDGEPEDDPTWGGSGLSLPRIQGADICGHVVAAGAEVDATLIGKRVIADTWLRDWNDIGNRNKAGYLGSEADGGFAEYCAIDHRNVAPIDSTLLDAELATFACSYSTAEGMLDRAQVGEGDRILVTGASGGVGSAVIQLGKRRGATVIGLASPSKHDDLRDLGADVLLPREPEDLAKAIRETTGHDAVTVVADVVGGPSFGSVIECLARGGRYTCSGAIAGPIVDLDLRTLYLNDLTFTGSTVTPPRIFRALLGYIERGEVRPVLAATYPLSDLKIAQEAFMSKTHTGNIVVVP